MKTHMDVARTLADEELLDRVKSLAALARGTTAELIAHLAEVETRNLHVAAGYSSMFAYCRSVLLLSEHAAYHRIEAARAARRFPIIVDRLAEGAVNLTAVALLAPQLTEDNHVEVIESARGLSKEEVKRLVARLAPVPGVPVSVRKLPAPRARVSEEVSSPTAAQAPTAPVKSAATAPRDLFAQGPVAPLPSPTIVEANARPAVVDALSPDRYKLQLTISGDTLDKLRLAKDMIRHAVPAGDEAEIIDRALTLLVADLAKKKFAATERPRPAQGKPAGREPSSDSRYISAEVKRTVWVRDLGRCAFVGTHGHRCEERGFLEFHHVLPFAEDGPSTVENIELRCRRHNLYEWELRSAEVRRLEEDWLRRQVMSGALPSRVARTRSGPSCSGRRSGAKARPASCSPAP